MQGKARTRLAFVAAAATLLAACGGGAADTTTTAAPSTTGAPGTTRPVSGGQDTTHEQWAAALAPGVCFDDVFDDEGELDFITLPDVVDCDQPHDNETVAIVAIDEPEGAPYPADIEAAADEACAGPWLEFAGLPLTDGSLWAYWVWPNEDSWAAGSRTIVCAAYQDGPMIGTVASAGLTAPGEVIAFLSEMDDIDVWTIAGDGTGATNVTADAARELTAQPGWSPDGTRIAYSAEVDGNTDIYVVNADGTGRARLTDDPGVDDTPVWSPDGTRIAFISTRANGEFDIFTMAADGSDVQRVTDNPDRDSSPSWHPDGTRIVYRARVDGNSNIRVTNAAGGILLNLTTDPAFDGDPTWSPDGTKILFTTDRTGDYEIFVMDADGANKVNLTNHPADDEFPTWSSDGAFIAFQSDRQYGQDVWLMRADGSDQTNLTQMAPSGYPRFRP
ncbi:MAG: septum formation family protein [Actinobacteria bacterium]|nr:septum formation family protein [Actinomycetota bacterium]